MDCYASVGGLFRPYLNHGGDYFAVPGTIGPIEVGADQLIDFLGREEKPFVYDGDLNWSTDLAFEDLLVEN